MFDNIFSDANSTSVEAFGFAVENAMKISPEEFPPMPPFLAMPNAGAEHLRFRSFGLCDGCGQGREENENRQAGFHVHSGGSFTGVLTRFWVVS